MPAVYTTEDRAFIGHDLPGICNRAIFCTNTPTSLLAGDRPVLRLIRYATLLGTLRLWVDTADGPLYLEDFASVKCSYRANLAEWELHDSRCPACICLSAGAPEGVEGFALRVQADAPVSLGWRFGGIYTFDDWHWNLTAGKQTELAAADTPAAWYADNAVTLTDGVFKLSAQNGSEGSGIDLAKTTYSEVYLRSSGPACAGENLPCAEGTLAVAPGTDGFIAAGRTVPAAPQEAFAAVLRRHETLQNVFCSRTPDAFLDAQMAVLSAEIDGAWYGQYTVHSNTTWNAPYLGWCNRFGNLLGGWIDRVRTEVAYYCGYVNTTNDLRGAQADPDIKYTVAAKDSRFYGIGHVDRHQMMYNMQTQFFDQAVFAWRMTADETLADLLRRALPYHTRWQDECFDPDNDGLYESVINTWPTDAVWYNGGGSCEETCYAYRSHQAALELAEAVGDTAEAAYHKERIAMIRRGFKEKLWLKDVGYPAMYVEAGGHGRAHRSAWLYNSFMPVDMDLLDPFEAAMCLDYPRWALENVPMPGGGKMLWISNWVPSIWSVRECSGGENFQQAYACFKAGFVDEGCALLSGTLRKEPDVFDMNISPGSIASESASLLARAVICGLHGFRADYPNGNVTIAPQYPAAWENAAIDTALFGCEYRRSGNRITYRFRLAQKAKNIRLVFPLPAAAITGLQGAAYGAVLPGFGSRSVELLLHDTDGGEVSFVLVDPYTPAKPMDIACAPGEVLTPVVDGVTKVYDPQGVLAESAVKDGCATLRLRDDMDGAHMVFLCIGSGEDALWQILRLAMSPTAAHLACREKCRPAPAQDRCEPLALSLPDDVRTIFRQNYYEPRTTMRLSIGSDGYTPWNFPYDRIETPTIGMEKADAVVTDREGAPYRIGSGENNIAFTSLYPQWPDKVTLPVGRKARAVKLLVCGSTNPMQIGIANGVLRFTYTDGSTEELELVNPDNFWALCPYNKPFNNDGKADYDYERDGFCLPETPPDLIHLGENCRAVSLAWQLAEGKELASVTLETLSQEVVIGLMAVTLVDPIA